MRSTAHVRIAIADSQPIFRLGVRTLLAHEPRFEIVAEAGDAAAALEITKALQPDILLLDHYPPRLNGLEVLRQLKALRVATRPIVMTTFMPEGEIQAALLHGAWGVVLKRTASDVLLDCIRQVMQAEHWIGLESVNALIGGLRSPAWGSSSLTRRELDIVRRVAKGASNKDIAWQLKLGEQTVKNHLRRIFRKLRIASRVELALLALENRVVLPNVADTIALD